MDFSKINYRSFVGRLLRLPLRLIPKRMVLPILQGRLRGRKWIVGAGEHGYWLGSYEMKKRLAFENTIHKGSVVYDVGANVGFYSLLAAELTGAEGRVYAFEPLPRNTHYLRKHIALNHMRQIEVFEAAVSDADGEAFFNLGASSAMGHLAQTGPLTVHQVRLDTLLAEDALMPPDYMKIDVEGAEYDVLVGASQAIEKYKPVLFIDTHHRNAHQKTVNFLHNLNYHLEILDGKSLELTRELLAFPSTKAEQ